jgi:predicted RNA-binding Zn ribbon-like protein
MDNVEIMTEAATAKRYEFIGGELCLDFCNSVGGSREDIPRESIYSYGGVVSWAEQAGLVNKVTAAGLLKKAALAPENGGPVLARAVELREAIYRIFFGLMQGKAPRKSDLGLLNSELARAQCRLLVGRGPKGFAWEWSCEEPGLDYPLGPIARSAADLLTDSRRLAQVRQCKGNNCGWLFLDGSKNHSRCWCDMRDCGNRAKVRRHRLKHRHGTQT